MTYLTETFLQQRREDLRKVEPPAVNGIERVSVNMADLEVDVIFVHPFDKVKRAETGPPAPVPPPDKENFTIRGGDSIRDIKVVGATKIDENTFRLAVDKLGDFSAYELAVLDLDAFGAPSHDPERVHDSMDPVLARIRFGFRTDCPSDFDCKTVQDPEPAPPESPVLNYLAKDYDSFRQAMFDRIAQLSPDHADRQIPDSGVALVELLSYYADHLSYAQDAAATEAYLSTARRRASVRRHAQLLGYDVHDGLSARSFVHVAMRGSGTFEADTLAFMTRFEAFEDGPVSFDDVDIAAILEQDAQVFEPIPLLRPDDPNDPASDYSKVPYALDEKLNRLILHDWGVQGAVLPRGTTKAWLRDPMGVTHPLKKGSYLSLEVQRDIDTRFAADARPEHRQIVCLTRDPVPEVDHVGATPTPLWRIEWHADDALRFDLPISTLTDLTDLDDGPPQMALAFGNIIPVDHGLHLQDAEALPLPDKDDTTAETDEITSLSELDRPRRYAPKLAHRAISVRADLRQIPGSASAASVTAPSGWQAPRKAITLLSKVPGGAEWHPVNTLLHSGATDRVFVPETEQDGTTTLRFGRKGEGGMFPSSESSERLFASYRVGVGRAGNIGADSIAHVLTKGVPGPVSARNPVPGQGGRERETVPEIRARAVAALDENRRAVTRADYIRLATEHPRVSRAHVRTIGHGSWDTKVIAIDPVGDVETDEVLLRDVREWLEPYRLMGQDIMVERPRFAPLEIELAICTCPDYLPSDVRRAVLRRLSSEVLPDGTLGFFHPDNLSFGQPIYHSHIVAAALSVPGVTDVRFVTFRRWRSTDVAALDNGVLTFDPAEIPILMNDPSYPERGVLRVREWSVA
jgi:hypothetical protein